MRRRPPRSTPLYSSAASDVYKRQGAYDGAMGAYAPGAGCHDGWLPKPCGCCHTGALEGCCHAGRGAEPGACHGPCWPGHEPYGDCVTRSGYRAMVPSDRFRFSALSADLVRRDGERVAHVHRSRREPELNPVLAGRSQTVAAVHAGVLAQRVVAESHHQRGDVVEVLSLIHISEPTRQAEISYAVF